MVHGRSAHGGGAVILVLNAAKVDPVVEDEPAGVATRNPGQMGVGVNQFALTGAQPSLQEPHWGESV